VFFAFFVTPSITELVAVQTFKQLYSVKLREPLRYNKPNVANDSTMTRATKRLAEPVQATIEALIEHKRHIDKRHENMPQIRN
jgi:hypothetical protein